MAIRVSWGIWNPHFWGKGGRRGSAMAPLERATVVSYRLSVVIVALSVTIRLQFAIECLRHSNQQGVGHFGPKFPGIPLVVVPWCLSLQRATSQVTKWWNYFGRIPTYVITIHQCQRHRRTDRQTDDMRSQARACTKVHRAVNPKILRVWCFVYYTVVVSKIWNTLK